MFFPQGPYALAAGIECAAWFNLGGGDPTKADVILTVASLSLASDKGIYLAVPMRGLTRNVFSI